MTDIGPALAVMVNVAPITKVGSDGSSWLINKAMCCPAVTSSVRLPPGMPPARSTSERVSVPSEWATSATPVTVVENVGGIGGITGSTWMTEKNETGSETEREVTVVAASAAVENLVNHNPAGEDSVTLQ